MHIAYETFENIITQNHHLHRNQLRLKTKITITKCFLYRIGRTLAAAGEKLTEAANLLMPKKPPATARPRGRPPRPQVSASTETVEETKINIKRKRFTYLFFLVFKYIL